MFLHKLSRWLAKYDPYYYSRLLGLKVAYTTVVLFLANLILHPPLASLIMLIAGAGVLLMEMPAINRQDNKDLVYLVYIILICLTIGLFSSYVYLKGWFILVAAGWCLILYRALRQKPQLFPLVSVVLMLGIMSLEGFNSGNFYVILNILLFILEFALIVFWAHKLFPNLYQRIWLNATLRTVESLRAMLQQIALEPSAAAFKHGQAARNVIDLIKTKPYLREALSFSNRLGYYHYYLTDLIANKSTPALELAVIEADLYQLEQAIRLQQPLIKRASVLNAAPDLAAHYELFPKLNLTWNKLCAHANN